jgi:hypothetical protein
MKREARSFLQRRPAAVVIERVRAARAPPRWRRWWPAAAVAVAAALALVVVNGRAPEQVRTKGSTFSTVVNGEAVLAPGLALHPGDHLAFVIETQRPGHALVLDLEEGKAVSAFAPFGGKASVAVPQGRTVLRDGVTLDDTSAAEWLVSLWCERALSIDELGLPAVVARPPPRIDPPGCRVEVFELTRSPR